MRILVIVALVAAVVSVEWFEEGNPHFLTGPVWNQTLNDPSHCKFIKFFTPWCRYCRVLKEIIDAHKATTYAESSDVKFYEVNCHVSPDICMPLKIYTVPMIIVVNQKGETKQTATGVYPKEWYVEVINNNCQVPKEEAPKKETEKQSVAQNQPQKNQTKKSLTRHVEQHKNTTKPEDKKEDSQHSKQNTVAEQEKHETAELNKTKEDHKAPDHHVQAKIPTPSPQHFAAEEDQKEVVVEEPAREKIPQKQDSPRTHKDELIEAPLTNPHKGQSFQTFVLLALALVVCFFLHNKFCNQNRNHQPI